MTSSCYHWQALATYWMSRSNLTGVATAQLGDTLCIHVVLWYHDDVIKWKHFPRYWIFHPSIHPYRNPFRLRCCPCPILWGWQHQATSNTGSPCISVMCVNASYATRIDISFHTFRPCLPGTSFHFSAGDLKVCDKSETGRGPLYRAMPSESPTAKDWCDVLNVKFL